MMKGRNFVFVTVVIVLTMFVMSSYVWAAKPCNPETEVLQGPVLQAVVVMDSANKWVSVRISPNLASQVNSQAWMFKWDGQYPDNSREPKFYRITEFIIKNSDNMTITGEPIIANEVNNFKKESTGIISFDAEIQFVVPKTQPKTQK